MTPPTCYVVRFKGHLCASVQSGLSRKPILLRAGKGETVFEAAVEWTGAPPGICEKRAIIECARAIKRTEHLRRRLNTDHLLRGAATIERLLRDYAMTRRGKRWKICPVTS